MMALRVCILSLCAAQAAQAQMISTEGVVPASVPVALHPVPFTLALPDGRSAGSFTYGDGARVELGGTTYKIADATDTNFLLRAASGALLGPFPYRDGATLRIGAQTYTLKTAVSFIRCKLALTNVVMPKVRLALVPLHGEASAQLARLQMTCARIKLELAYETAPRQLDVPVVRGPLGYRREVDIKRSAVDIARAETSADSRARQAFEYFQNRKDTRVTTLLKQDEFTFRDLPAGFYAICVMADVRSATDARTFRTRPLVWWATASLQDEECAVVLFEQNQGRDWRELFPQ